MPPMPPSCIVRNRRDIDLIGVGVVVVVEVFAAGEDEDEEDEEGADDEEDDDSGGISECKRYLGNAIDTGTGKGGISPRLPLMYLM